MNSVITEYRVVLCRSDYRIPSTFLETLSGFERYVENA